MKTKSLAILIALFALMNIRSVYAQIYATQLVGSGPCHPVSISCLSGVTNAGYAVDFESNNYALMQTAIGLSYSSTLKVGFSSNVPGGYIIGIILNEDAIPLTAEVLAALSVKLFDENGNVVATKAKFTLAQLKVLNSGLKVLRVYTKAGTTIKTVKIELKGLLTLLNSVRIYGVFSAANCPEVYATSVYAHGPCNPIVPILCPGGVVNSSNAVSVDNNDYAVMTIPLGIAGTSYLDLSFASTGKAGERTGFVIEENNTPINVNLLANLNLKVYDESDNVVSNKNLTVAELEASILEPGKYRVGVTTPYGTYQIKRARLTLTSLVSVLSDLRVYKSFHLPANYFKMDITANGPLSFCSGGNVKFTCPGSTSLNTFQWYKNNLPIGGATSKSYTATSAGAYHVVRTFDGCQSVSFFQNVTVPCRLNDGIADGLIISPNPFSEYFEIALPEPVSGKGLVKIMDMTGKSVSIINWNTASTLKLGNELAPGIYLVNVDDGLSNRTVKIMRMEN